MIMVSTDGDDVARAQDLDAGRRIAAVARDVSQAAQAIDTRGVDVLERRLERLKVAVDIRQDAIPGAGRSGVQDGMRSSRCATASSTPFTKRGESVPP